MVISTGVRLDAPITGAVIARVRRPFAVSHPGVCRSGVTDDQLPVGRSLSRRPFRTQAGRRAGGCRPARGEQRAGLPLPEGPITATASPGAI